MQPDLHRGPVVTPLAAVGAAPGAAGRATMRDVAALAGVSLKTVSRVVNGAPTVDADLAARVRRAAAQLNYRHNMTASNLRRGDRRSFMIGLMLEDMANPYSSVIYRAVEDAARARGVGVLAGSTPTCAASRTWAPPWSSSTGPPCCWVPTRSWPTTPPAPPPPPPTWSGL